MDGIRSGLVLKVVIENRLPQLMHEERIERVAIVTRRVKHSWHKVNLPVAMNRGRFVQILCKRYIGEYIDDA